MNVYKDSNLISRSIYYKLLILIKEHVLVQEKATSTALYPKKYLYNAIDQITANEL